MDPKWYKNGQKRIEGTLKDGKGHGTVIEYREDGSKLKETPRVDGIKNWYGTEIIYYEDGSKKYVTPFVDGKRHGTAIRYREDGSKERETVWENGNIISNKKF